MAIIRRMKTTSGATAVQIAYKKSNIVKIIRTGSAHSGEELNILLAFAFKRLQVDRLALFPETQRSLRVCIKVRFPFFFWKFLREQYHNMRFRKWDAIEAHLTIVFAALVIGRNIEYQTGISIKQFVKLPARSDQVLLPSMAMSF
jgi:hypothetical protein